MGKAISKFQLTCGLLSIPVSITTLQRDDSIHFNQLCPQQHRIGKVNFCPTCNKNYGFGELLKGFALGEDKYKVFTKEEISNLKDRTTDMRILKFIDGNEIPFYLYDKSYNLTPQTDRKKGVLGEHTYCLFKEALKVSGLVGICKFTMREKEHLAVIRQFSDRLILTILYYPSEISMEENITSPVNDEELQLGVRLLEGMSIRTWSSFYTMDNEDVRDKYRERVYQLIKDGKLTEEVKPITTGVSLAEQLKQSIAVMEKKREETVKV